MQKIFIIAFKIFFCWDRIQCTPENMQILRKKNTAWCQLYTYLADIYLNISNIPC